MRDGVYSGVPKIERSKILLMIDILHYLKDPKLWELWYIPYYGLLQDLYHQPYF